MEESCEMHSDEDKSVPENKKRRLKTPSQVEALEKFYNEHKYPTESMKSQLAQEVGLSEKQISGWFCHRRLKDKKVLKDEACATGKQDLSSAIIQDRGSGLGQDSCSSAKQGECKNFESREVESRRFYTQDYPSADFACESKNQYMHPGNYGATNDTSSGSSTASQDRLFPQSVTPYDMESLKYSSRKNHHVILERRGSRNRGYVMESGYLNLQEEFENAAITAVKRKLGKHYQEDGPPLGVEFQPLPPGAFDLPIRDLIHDSSAVPYYVGDPIMQKSHSISRVRKQPKFRTQSEGYNSKMNPQGTYPESAHYGRTVRKSDRQDDCTRYPSNGKSSSNNYSHHPPGWSSALDDDEDSAEEASAFDRTKSYIMRSKNGVAGLGASITDRHNRPYGRKFITTEASYPHLESYDNPNPLMPQKRSYLEAKPSNFILQHSESIDTEDGEMYGNMAKEEKLHRERSISRKYGNPVRMKMDMKNELRVCRRLRGDEFRPREVSENRSPHELQPWTNQIKGFTGEMPTSFSDDETVATSSSTD